MGPPSSAPHNPPPPSVGPNSHTDVSIPPDGPQDNGVSSSGSSSNSSLHPVTSIVTTGPDGAPLDEASQQSTLSNASAGEFRFSFVLLLFVLSRNLFCLCSFGRRSAMFDAEI